MISSTPLRSLFMGVFLLGGLTLGPTQVQAVALTNYTVDEIMRVEGIFKDGATFKLEVPLGASPLEDFSTNDPSLIYKLGDFQKNLPLTSLSNLLFRTSLDLAASQYPYVIPPSSGEDRVVLFANLTTLTYLGENGQFGLIHLFQPTEDIETLHISATREDYAFFSIHFKENQRQIRILRMSDGEVFRPEDDYSNLQISDPLQGLQIDAATLELKTASGNLICKLVSEKAEGTQGLSATPRVLPPKQVISVVHDADAGKPIREATKPVEPTSHIGTLTQAEGEISAFSNGAGLLITEVEGQRVLSFLAPEKTSPRFVIRSPEIQIPRIDLKQNGPLKIVFTDSVVGVILENGEWVPLPARRHRIVSKDGEVKFSRLLIKNPMGQNGEVDAHQYHLISLNNHTGPKGETYLIRDDGAFVLIDLEARALGGSTPSKDGSAVVQIKDGVLSLPGSPRPISLNQFELEAGFFPRKMEIVRKGDGTEISDVLTYVDQEYPDMGEKLRTGEIRGMPFSSEKIRPTIERLEEVLLQREASSAIITGPSGSGKSQFAYAFFKALINGELKIPKTTKVFKLDTLNLSQGTNFVGSMESKIKAVVESAKVRPTILFIDEIQNILQAGAHMSNPIGFMSLILEGLATGNLKVVGTCTDYDYIHYFKNNPVFGRRLPEVKIPEPSRDEILTAMRNWIQHFIIETDRIPPSRAAQYIPPQEVLEYILDLSENLIAEGSQPSRSNRVLDAAYARLRAGRGEAGFKYPTISVIQDVAIHAFHAHRALFDPVAAQEKLDTLRAALDRTHTGQEPGKALLEELTQRRLTRTLSSTLMAGFVGFKGTGKTSLFTSWAEHMGYGEPKVISMAKYSNGDTQGFFREIAQALETHSYAAIVLDELDAAHTDVQTDLQVALERGYFVVPVITNSANGAMTLKKVNLKHSAITFTTNLGSRFLEKFLSGATGTLGFAKTAADPTVQEISLALKEAIIHDQSHPGRIILPTLLDRFHYIVPFLPTDDEIFAEAVRLHLQRAIEKQTEIQRAAVTLEGTEELIQYAVSHYYRAGVSLRVSDQAVNDLFLGAVAAARGKFPAYGNPLHVVFKVETADAQRDRMSGCGALLRARDKANKKQEKKTAA